MKKADIIIIGGGVMGSSTAYHLRNIGYEGRIIVFEKDPIYEFSSTARSAGGIRQLYTTDINIQLSRHSLQVYKQFPKEMELDGEQATIDFKQRGYLFLGNKEMIPMFKKQQLLQRKYGVPSEVLSAHELQKIIHELNIEDLAGGLYCHEDGYLDPYSIMQSYRKHAQRRGVEYLYQEVDGILEEQKQITGIRLVDGTIYQSPIVINCAGAWGVYLSEKIGISLPVHPLKRQIFQFDIEKPLNNELPLTVDPTGVYFRHEGKKILTGFSEETKPGIDFTVNRSLFYDEMWPILAHRIPNFERVKMTSSWAGLYSFNTVDHNAIIGKHPSMSGYYMALGFSGHGMQQAPGVGQGLAELIYFGHYKAIDLTPLRFERFAENDLVLEDAVV
ncbi:glycine/D-amino acid oxidase-like deaminating enzyme [Oikeobacillus pervagus]|uniref:Glycine/D-amino acid oxidase-like deaminating enzyme n=1 Tax=Oikeobacillus pervagus TaxID=1325931 RepID=A0AAJ1SWI5_9BACI|nr:FAD-binding oxidoreductase [Oikeobacillus pervagus]MDQ0214148.1 glycine/D-amino acid oxidase-like deaminating enzyme [Oikeobacillus pervagus]